MSKCVQKHYVFDREKNLAEDQTDGFVVMYDDVRQHLPENNPVMPAPMGPGFWWYVHPDDPQQGKYDPTIIEVGIKGDSFVCKMGGDIVPVELLTGQWQRVILSSFHGEKTDVKS